MSFSDECLRVIEGTSGIPWDIKVVNEGAAMRAPCVVGSTRAHEHREHIPIL